MILSFLTFLRPLWYFSTLPYCLFHNEKYEFILLVIPLWIVNYIGASLMVVKAAILCKSQHFTWFYIFKIPIFSLAVIHFDLLNFPCPLIRTSKACKWSGSLWVLIWSWFKTYKLSSLIVDNNKYALSSSNWTQEIG